MRVSWHTYAVYYTDGMLGVYNPSFIVGIKRFDSCSDIPLAKELVKILSSKGSNHKLREIWLGGGGNNGLRCQEMTRKSIEHKVVVKRGVDLGNGRRVWGRLSSTFSLSLNFSNIIVFINCTF